MAVCRQSQLDHAANFETGLQCNASLQEEYSTASKLLRSPFYFALPNPTDPSSKPRNKTKSHSKGEVPRELSHQWPR